MRQTPTSTRGRAAPVLALLSAAALLVAAACSGSGPTPIIVVVTASPSPTPSASATGTATATPTLGPSTSATAKPSATATATAAATATSTGPAVPTPTSAANGCYGNSGNWPWWVDAANHEAFSVYCGHNLGGSWYFAQAGATYASSYQLVAVYKTSGGGVIVLMEGKYCVGTSTCPTHLPGGTSGKHFGDLSAIEYTTTAAYNVTVPGGVTPDPYVIMPLGSKMILSTGTYGWVAIWNNVGTDLAGFETICSNLFKVVKA
jgi:hypothetical protein